MLSYHSWLNAGQDTAIQKHDMQSSCCGHAVTPSPEEQCACALCSNVGLSDSKKEVQSRPTRCTPAMLHSIKAGWGGLRPGEYVIDDTWRMMLIRRSKSHSQRRNSPLSPAQQRGVLRGLSHGVLWGPKGDCAVSIIVLCRPLMP